MLEKAVVGVHTSIQQPDLNLNALEVSGPLKTFLDALGKGIADVKPAVITVWGWPWQS